MKRRTSLLPLLLLALVSGAARGGTPVEAPPAPATSALSSVADFERLLKRIDDEQRSVEAELAGIEPRIETVRKRMLARGRAYYRHVHAGLLPVGEGFDALVDHAARVERVRRALERAEKARAVSAGKQMLRRHAAGLLIRRELDREPAFGGLDHPVAPALRNHLSNVNGFHGKKETARAARRSALRGEVTVSETA